MRRGLLCVAQTAWIALVLVTGASAQAACSAINVTGQSFGDYVGEENDATAQITVRCKKNFAYSITIDGGRSGDVNARTMTGSGANRLRYFVYRDAARTAIWTNTPGTTINGVGNNADQSYTVYARIPARQVVVQESYLDFLIIAAGGASTQVPVATNVKSSCNISAGALNFGSYTGAVLDGVGTLSVSCNTPTKYEVGLGVGNAPGATVTSRKMTGPSASTLGYLLFSDAGRTINWGDIGGSGTVTGSGTGTAQTLTVYGRILTGQSISAPGSYTDTVVVTVRY